VFLTFAGNAFGLVGLAWVGTVCNSDKGLRASITEYFFTNSQTAHVNCVIRTESENGFIMKINNNVLIWDRMKRHPL
jgi:hypothetical protein